MGKIFVFFVKEFNFLYEEYVYKRTLLSLTGLKHAAI